MDICMRGKPFTRYRKQVLEGVSGSVLEIGAGTGLNFEHYPKAIELVTTVDPNPGMSAKARKRSSTHNIKTDFHQITAEKLPFEDDTFDFVVSTWTLCSIPNVQAALSEVCRVLKPGGRFHYVEHGRAPDSGVAKWQRRLTPIQKVIADGCHLDRPMYELVEASGLRHISSDEHYVPKTPKIAGFFYIGVAEKS